MVKSSFCPVDVKSDAARYHTSYQAYRHLWGCHKACEEHKGKTDSRDQQRDQPRAKKSFRIIAPPLTAADACCQREKQRAECRDHRQYKWLDHTEKHPIEGDAEASCHIGVVPQIFDPLRDGVHY